MTAEHPRKQRAQKLFDNIVLELEQRIAQHFSYGDADNDQRVILMPKDSHFSHVYDADFVFNISDYDMLLRIAYNNGVETLRRYFKRLGFNVVVIHGDIIIIYNEYNGNIDLKDEAYYDV